MKYKERYSTETVSTPQGKVESKGVKRRFIQTLGEDPLKDVWISKFDKKKVVTIDEYLHTLEPTARETARKFIYGYHI